MPRSRMSTLMPAWNGTISVTGLFGYSEASPVATVEIARPVKPASASGIILRDNIRMRVLPTMRSDRLRRLFAKESAAAHPCAYNMSVVPILPPEQKPGTHVKAPRTRNENVDAIAPIPDINQACPEDRRRSDRGRLLCGGSIGGRSPSG